MGAFRRKNFYFTIASFNRFTDFQATSQSMTPLQRYQSDLEKNTIVADQAQLAALDLLEDLHQDLTSARRLAQTGLVGRIRSLLGKNQGEVPKGIYFWGGVGIGKTYLMDIFFDCLPIENKLRTHFHRFMQGIHNDLRGLKGRKDPLKQVAGDIAARARVICFDEFFVSDIGDAMILAGLLEELFARRVLLVMTSNIEPARLYENGLQRDRFLPAIALLESNMQIHQLRGETDYRLRCLSQAELYHWPLDAGSDEALLANFTGLAPDFAEAVEGAVVEVLGRPIVSRYAADDVIWFDFEQLCGGPRSVHDYIELARVYHALLLGNVPQLNADRDDQARRFIHLVDELYDRGVKLILSAAVPLNDLYAGKAMRVEFQRTESRLLEMQSHEYLSRPHKP
jgi:cell division protein ZapE